MKATVSDYYDQFYTREYVRRSIKDLRKYLDRAMNKTYQADRISTFTELTAMKAYIEAMLEECKNCKDPEWPDNE